MKELKWILASILVALPIISFAQIISFGPLAKTPFSGFYVGGSVGASFDKAVLNVNVSSINPTGAGTSYTNTFIGKQDLHKTASRGALFLGYGTVFQYLYVGGELGVNDGKRRISQQFNPVAFAATGAPDEIMTYTTNLHVNNFEWSIDLMPGILITPTTLVYGRLGAAFNRITLDGSITAADVFPVLAENVALSYSGQTNYRVNPRFGLGVQKYITHNFSLRTDYIFTHYGTLPMISNTTPWTAGIAGEVLNSNSEVRDVHNHVVLVGIVYNLNGLIDSLNFPYDSPSKKESYI